MERDITLSDPDGPYGARNVLDAVDQWLLASNIHANEVDPVTAFRDPTGPFGRTFLLDSASQLAVAVQDYDYYEEESAFKSLDKTRFGVLAYDKYIDRLVCKKCDKVK